jgi:outer membrane lipoprotein LolB
MPATWSLDPYGRLASLSQNGWEVQFESYEPAGTLDLPQRLTILGREAEVRMLARRWSVELAKAQ